MNIDQWVADRVEILLDEEMWKGTVSVVRSKRPGASLAINIEARNVIAQFVVWSSGAMEATAVSVEKGDTFYRDAGDVVNSDQLGEKWARFLGEISQAEQAPR